MDAMLQVFLLTTLGSLAGLMGGVIILTNKKIASRISLHAIPFAAGVFLAVTFLDLLPEAVEHGEIDTIAPILLITIISAFFFEKILSTLHHHREESHPLHNSAPLVVIGDTIHNFIDGVVIASSFLVNPSLGFVVALATFLHEVPHEIADFGIMLSAGWAKKRVLSVNIFSALSTYIGAATVFLFADNITNNLHIALSIAAGLFIYIGTSDLFLALYDTHKERPWLQSAILLLGVGLIVAVSQFIPH